jgi:hypothetical protein
MIRNIKVHRVPFICTSSQSPAINDDSDEQRPALTKGAQSAALFKSFTFRLIIKLHAIAKGPAR